MTSSATQSTWPESLPGSQGQNLTPKHVQAEKQTLKQENAKLRDTINVTNVTIDEMTKVLLLLYYSRA